MSFFKKGKRATSNTYIDRNDASGGPAIKGNCWTYLKSSENRIRQNPGLRRREKLIGFWAEWKCEYGDQRTRKKEEKYHLYEGEPREEDNLYDNRATYSKKDNSRCPTQLMVRVFERIVQFKKNYFF